MGKVTVFDHPLIKHKLIILRDKNTGSNQFRRLVSEIATLVCYEVTRDFRLEDCEVETPIGKTTGQTLSGKKLEVVPILRAGLGTVEGSLNALPAAKVEHIELYRDPETLEPVEYYCELPKGAEERDIIVVDPALATGGLAETTITFLKEHGCKSIKLVNIIAAPEGIKMVQEKHPNVNIYVVGLDEKLNDHGYIVPGLGDAGGRLSGTK